MYLDRDEALVSYSTCPCGFLSDTLFVCTTCEGHDGGESCPSFLCCVPIRCQAVLGTEDTTLNSLFQRIDTIQRVSKVRNPVGCILSAHDNSHALPPRFSRSFPLSLAPQSLVSLAPPTQPGQVPVPQSFLHMLTPASQGRWSRFGPGEYSPPGPTQSHTLSAPMVSWKQGSAHHPERIARRDAVLERGH